jgi:hypothetical protein
MASADGIPLVTPSLVEKKQVAAVGDFSDLPVLGEASDGIGLRFATHLIDSLHTFLALH